MTYQPIDLAAAATRRWAAALPNSEPLETIARQAVTAYNRGEDLIITAAQHVLECQRRVYGGEYSGTWGEFCAEHLQEIKERRIRQLLAIAKAPDPRAALLEHREENAERNAEYRERLRTGISDAVFTQQEAGNETPADARETIDRALGVTAPSHALRVMGSSESDEWYTPAHIFDLAVTLLGEIDLDPSWHPDSPIRARTTYTRADNGLPQQWAGRVWLNPPYSEVGSWVEKLVQEHNAGNVTEALALIPARVDTRWFRHLDPFPHCFVFGRLRFSNSENSAPFPATVTYLGPNVERFVEVFGSIGGIWVRLGTQLAEMNQAA